MTLKQKASLKWGIIGPGNIAQDFIADMGLVTIIPNTVISVVSNELYEAEAFAVQHQIPAYFDSVEDMLEDEVPDIVYVSSPHAAHYEQTMKCLQNKVAVLCEKPCALNHEQVIGLIDMAKAHDTFLLEGMWIRFLPSIHQVIDLLHQNVIGKVNSIVASMSYRAPIDADNRFYNPELGGGSLLDLGIYPVYLSLLILGMPSVIKSTAILSSKGVDESCAIILEYPQGAYALLESSIIKDTNNMACIYGEKGYISILKPWNEKPAGINVSLYDGNSMEYSCHWEGRGFQFEIQEIIRCLNSQKIESEQHSHDETLKLMRLLDEIRAQIRVTYPLESINE